jgi:hypothetical protein
MQIKVQALDDLRVDLRSEDPLRRRRSPSPAAVASRISLGRPLIQHFSPGALGAEPAADGASYALVRAAITLWPSRDERFEQVWLSIAASGAVIWSMVPGHVGRSLSVGDTVTVGANFKFVEVKAESRSERQTAIPLITPFGLMEDLGGWELSGAGGEELRGSYEFAAVLRSPHRGGRISGGIHVDATVRRTRFGLIAVRAQSATAPADSDFTIALSCGAAAEDAELS